MPEAHFGVAALPAPWSTPAVTPADISAIKALVRGNANEAQQLRVVEWMRKATGIGELEFRPECERATAFASGKRFVGLQFFTLSQS